jgi:hypothetical protein
LVKLESPYELAGDYLEGDVQTPHDVTELLDLTRRVASGELSHWEGTGNAFTVTLLKDRVKIACEFGDRGSVELRPEDFEDLLERWGQFLAKGP